MGIHLYQPYQDDDKIGFPTMNWLAIKQFCKGLERSNSLFYFIGGKYNSCFIFIYSRDLKINNSSFNIKNSISCKFSSRTFNFKVSVKGNSQLRGRGSCRESRDFCITFFRVSGLSNSGLCFHYSTDFILQIGINLIRLPRKLFQTLKCLAFYGFNLEGDQGYKYYILGYFR